MQTEINRKRDIYECGTSYIYCLDLMLPISAIMISGILQYLGQIEVAAITNAINLLALFFVSAHTGNRKYLAIMFIPLFNLIGLTTPIFFHNALYSFILVYSIMFIPICTLIKSRRFSPLEIGIVTKDILRYSPIAIALGFILGWIEFQILKPNIFALNHGFFSAFWLSLMLIIIVGFVEEFIYRSMLQTTLEQELGDIRGLVAASLIFGIMFSIYGILSEIIFGFCAGLAIGFLFQRTRSLPLIALAHVIANVYLFIIAPAIYR